MKKSFIVLLFILSQYLVSYSQNDTITHVKRKKERRIHLKFFYTPSYSFKKSKSNMTLGVHSNTYGNGWTTYSYESKNEIGTYGYEGGLLLDIDIMKNIYLSTGFSFEELNYRTLNNTLFRVRSGGNMILYPTSYDTDEITLLKKYRFVSIPLTANYVFRKNKLKFSLGAGASFDLLYSYMSTERTAVSIWSVQYEARRPVDPNEQYEPVYFISFISNAGISYSLRKSLEIGIGPHFKFYFANPSSYNRVLDYARFDYTMKLFSTGLSVFLKF